MNQSHSPTVRKAVVSDEPAILALVDALADYEKLARPTASARARLMRDMFGERPRIDCFLAFMDGYPVGYAIVLETYSSFLALPTLYLEDLFILEEYRQRGVGKALFGVAVEEAHRRGCGRMEWTVLAWNQLAIGFYQKLGAEHMREWQLYRITFGE
ncbi:MAG TPA: GNAT family N-acetyltransferase [Bryobacteraceae bacterium]|nr:GNAT family N-acetyltransferase [Bryobacteraceae bacterium]